MKRFAAVLLSLPLSCFAVDGAIEINQLCVDSGCFSGDGPGWPVTLPKTGTYRLTSNLDVSGYDNPGSITAIEITAPNVSLDLNGFSIKGAKLPGSGNGIVSNDFGTTVVNGHVTAMGYWGIVCGDHCRVDKVVASSNGYTGIEMAGVGILSNSASSNNSNNGVAMNGIVKNCVISGNAVNGLNVGGRSLVEGNEIVDNGQDGVACNGCSLTDNVIAGNGGKGVFFSGTASFGGNHIYKNADVQTNVPMFQTAPNNCDGAPCP